jgi:hypothetical protein
VGRQQSFRATVQPLVREAVMRGTSVSEIARVLRDKHGRAYRRTDLLADIRLYRASAHETVGAAPSRVAHESRLHWTLAHAGVAVFAITLLIPTIVYDVTRARGNVLVSAASEERSAAGEVSLPNQVAERPRRMVTPQPTPEPAPEPTPAPTPPPVVLVPGGPGAVVTASWYGPGFFENRLPCWQWLQANGLPIQFLPDTWGVAHKTLPCGTMLVLTHGARTITVPVVDRGPYVAGRELDLSPRIKSELGCTDLCTVRMQLP